MGREARGEVVKMVCREQRGKLCREGLRASDFVTGVKSFIIMRQKLLVEFLINSLKVVVGLLLLDHSCRVAGIGIGTASPGGLR